MDSPLRKLYPPSTLERWAPIRHRQNMFDRRIRGWGYKVNHAKDKSNGDATGARTSNRKRKPKGSGDRQARSGMLGTPNETKFSDSYRQATEGGSWVVDVSLAGVMKYLRSLGQYEGRTGFDEVLSDNLNAQGCLSQCLQRIPGQV